MTKFPAIAVRLKSGEQMIIREATCHDAADLVAYVESISGESDFLTFGPGEFGITVDEERKFLESFSKRKNGLYLIAMIDGKIVGTLSFSGGTRPRTAHCGEFGLSVRRDHWGKGIGTALLGCFLQWCKDSKVIRKVNLKVRTDNEAAIGLYKKMGFKVEGVTTRNFLVNGVFYDSLIMGCEID